MKTLLWIFLIISLSSISIFADEEENSVWVDTEGLAYLSGNTTADEAKNKALNSAILNAIEKVVGVNLTAQQLALKTETVQDFRESFTELIKTAYYGRVIKQENHNWTTESVQLSPNEPPIPVLRVSMRARVVKETGKPDPSFNVKLKLNSDQLNFRDWEEVILKIQSSQDCYITVFNVLSDHKVLVLFPNDRMKDNHLKADKVFELPDEEWRNRGIHFRVGLLPDKERDAEMLFVVATKSPMPFLASEKTKETKTGDYLVLPTYQVALTELNRWLVSIPLEERAESMIVYSIHKK